jgi:hypothetical protein
MKKPEITFQEATASLAENELKLVTELHQKAQAINYKPFISKAGSKGNNYKIEYKANKKAYVLFITRISGNKPTNQNISLGCKLLNLGKYTNLLPKLSNTLRTELLSSRPCDLKKGCTAYIQFTYEGTEYFICRHAIRLKTVQPSDVSAFWNLLEAEATHRQEV